MNSQKRILIIFSFSLCLLGYVACHSQIRQPNNARSDSNVSESNVVARENINFSREKVALSASAENTSTLKTDQQQNSSDLKTWVGKYPRNQDDKNFRNFFALPKVKQRLIKVLGYERYIEYTSPKSKSG